MAEKPEIDKKPISADWLVQGVLTRIGDAFDRLTGRGWKPSSSIATSELAERLKKLVDGEVRTEPDGRRFVPHNISLKMQWDKFSTDSETGIQKLENELLTSLVDHINDCRYHTFSPLSLKVQSDYFTEGVKLFASFDKVDEEMTEASVNVSLPGQKIDVPQILGRDEASVLTGRLTVNWLVADGSETEHLDVAAGQRLSVGRTKESDLSIDDPSVSKMHASLLLESGGGLVVADTGSTNGTFVNGVRLPYGTAEKISPQDVLRFGSIDVKIHLEFDSVAAAGSTAASNDSETVRIGEFEFSAPPESAQPSPQASVPNTTSVMTESVILGPLKEAETVALSDDPGTRS